MCYTLDAVQVVSRSTTGISYERRHYDGQWLGSPRYMLLSTSVLQLNAMRGVLATVNSFDKEFLQRHKRAT